MLVKVPYQHGHEINQSSIIEPVVKGQQVAWTAEQEVHEVVPENNQER